MANTQEKYKTDPEFKKKHLAMMCEKIKCECGRTVTRGNLATHKKTSVHKHYDETKNLTKTLKVEKSNTTKVLFDLRKKLRGCGKEKSISEAIDIVDDLIDNLGSEK